MKQLTLGDILLLKERIEKGTKLSAAEIAALPIYLGDDDELNGIHGGWYCDYVTDKQLTDDDKYMIELITDNRCNPKFNHKAIIIS
jgi:hypothetical protein